MSQPRKATVSVKGTEIAVPNHRDQDFISLTDIARHRNPDHTDDLIRNWLRNRNTIEQLLVLATIEGMNAELIHMGLAQNERLKRLNEIAIRQMQVLTAAPAVKQLKKGYKGAHHGKA